jgi:hypothetical protein
MKGLKYGKFKRLEHFHGWAWKFTATIPATEEAETRSLAQGQQKHSKSQVQLFLL